MRPEAGDGAASPAEERLLRLLDGLREHAPEPDHALPAAVIRSARWQGAIRPFALAAGRLLGGMGEAARTLAGPAA